VGHGLQVPEPVGVNMSIAVKQNTPRALELLAAARATYSRAKGFRAFRVIASAGFAIAAPLVAIGSNSASALFAGMGAVLAAAAQLFCQPHEKRLVGRGAHLQDHFDSHVFGLVPRRHADVIDEETAAAARACSQPERLKDWYRTTDRLPDRLLVLLAQRSSLVWNLRQRKYYAVLVGAALTALFVVDLAVGREMTAETWMLALVMPSFAGFVHGIEVIRDHVAARVQEQAALDEVERHWSAAVAEPSTLTPEVLRGVQDLLLRLRADHASVPDWLHRVLRANFDRDAQGALERRADDYERARGAIAAPTLSRVTSTAESGPPPVGTASSEAGSLDAAAVPSGPDPGFRAVMREPR